MSMAAYHVSDAQRFVGEIYKRDKRNRRVIVARINRCFSYHEQNRIKKLK